MIRTQGAKRSVLSHPPPSLSECRPQVLYPLQEDSKDHALQHSDYAHNLSQNPSKLSESDIELRMLRERDTEKVKRSENKVCIPFPLDSPTPLASLPTSLARFSFRVRFRAV